MTEKSLFEGWTRQAYHFYADLSSNAHCAIGWLYHDPEIDINRRPTIIRVGERLAEIFPEIDAIIYSKIRYTMNDAILNEHRITIANDHLKLPPEVFLSIDRECIEKNLLDSTSSSSIETTIQMPVCKHEIPNPAEIIEYEDLPVLESEPFELEPILS